MKNVKTAIKAGMIIKTEGYLMFTIKHLFSKKLVAISIVGGPSIGIDDYYDETGFCRCFPRELTITGVYKFIEDCEDEFNTIVFNNEHKASAVRDIFEEYVEDGILVKVA